MRDRAAKSAVGFICSEWSRTIEPEAAQASANPVATHARLARILSAYGRVALPVGKTRFEKREGKGWADRMGGACSLLNSTGFGVK